MLVKVLEHTIFEHQRRSFLPIANRVSNIAIIMKTTL